MSTFDLDTLLSKLSEFPANASLQQVEASIRVAEPPAITEAKKRCALVRWFDAQVYEFLCGDIFETPTFFAFCRTSAVDRLAPGKWIIEESERSRLLDEWRADQIAWRGWNERIGQYYLTQSGKEAQLEVVYHLAASSSPETLTSKWQQWFDQANEQFDMAQSNALLEMLRLQEKWRGVALSQLWVNSRQHYLARLLFADDYYRSGSYFQRGELFDKFESVLNRKAGDHTWIFHMNATGGAGKTIFQRWLTSRYLVPKNIMSARVDFDDFRLDEVVKFPLGLFRRIAEQFAQQPQGQSLSSLVEKLVQEENKPGWNADLMGEMGRQMRGSGITTQIVVILDTLEEVTISAANWLKECVDRLRTIHANQPMLTLVLSGRYDIATRSSALVPGEFLNYELPRFSESEAHAYLQIRGISAGPVRDAIVARSASDEANDQFRSPKLELSGRNPFKLAIFAELALSRATLTPDEVMRFPRADIAYLIERVIKRIESQPLRWMIRYGAVARHLTLEFAQAVLMPPLLEALRGGDKGAQVEISRHKDVWMPDTEAADALETRGIAELWDHLAAYARDRGWLSSVTVEGQVELRFHPDVINPTRDLLHEQGIFPELQQRSIDFFERKSASDIESLAKLHNLQEAVFHRFQLHREGAEDYWIQKMREVERFGPAAALTIATEITGREYAEAERIPRDGISSADILLRAHCEAADLLLQATGVEFSSMKAWPDFSRHLELALQIAGDNPYLSRLIPPMLLAIYRAWQADDPDKLIARLRNSLRFAKDPRDQVFLELQLGQKLTEQMSSEAPVHFRRALLLLLSAERTPISATEVYLELANHYQFHGVHTAVVDGYKSAIQSAGTDPVARARVLNLEVAYLISVRDIAIAHDRLSEMRSIPREAHPSSAALNVLEARLALAKLDPFTAIAAAQRGLQLAATENDRARCLDQEGEAQALLYRFNTALNNWDSAASRYDAAGSIVGSARCALLAVRLKALVMGDYSDAETRIQSALSLRGSRDIEIQTELGLVQAFMFMRTGRRAQAAPIIAELTARPEIPARIRSRVLLFSLIFNLQNATADFLDELEACVGQIQPLSLRHSLLDWLEHADSCKDLNQGFARRLLVLFGRPRFDSKRGAELLIQRADLYRVFGMPENARVEGFRAVETDSFLLSWRLNLARLRLGLDTQFGDLLHQSAKSSFVDTPLYNAVRIGAAVEALRASDSLLAETLMKDIVGKETEQLPIAWETRRASLMEEVSKSAGVEAQTSEKPGDTIGPEKSRHPPTLESTAITISDKDLPPSLAKAASSPEFTIDRLSADWLSFASELQMVLRARGQTGPIQAIGPVAALPWELAGVPHRQSAKAGQPRGPAGSPNEPGTIRLIIAGEGELEAGFAPDSGSSLESVYFGLGLKPSISYSPDPDTILKELLSSPFPVLLHIVAAMRESSGGLYLDFAGGVHRAESFAGSSDAHELLITPFRLDRMLTSLPNPPFVILDITRPYNFTEGLRMLLQRNLFSTQLFELGHVRGILGCGLASPSERVMLSSLIVEALTHDTVGSPVTRLATSGIGDLNYVLPRMAAALWTNEPNERLFIR